MSRISSFTTLFLLTLSTTSASNARLRNTYQLQHEINRMEERIDMLEQQLENSSSTSCTFDEECSDLPQCDNGYGGNQCYCQLPMGVCDGQFLTEQQTGHCVKQRFGCNRSLKPVVGCDGKYYGNPSCAQAAAVNVLCDIRADPDCTTAPTNTDPDDNADE